MQDLINAAHMQKAKYLQANNIYPFFRPISATDATCVKVGEKKELMFGSNNYLGLTHHPYVIEQAKKAMEKFGTGCTGSRFLNGNLILHEELEEKLQEYTGREKAIVFPTGMQVNLGSIPCIAMKGDVILSDAENHASIIDAIKFSPAEKIIFNHNDVSDLEEKLISIEGKYKRTIIIVDGVYSMTGDIAKLDEIVPIAKKYGAYVYVDDAHGMGVMGHQGRGTTNHFGLTDDVTFIMGTFSKSFASIGGFIAGDYDLINYIKHTARTFMFSASMPPSAVATVIACIEVVQSDPSILKNLWDNVEFMRKGFKDLGFYTYDSQSPIIPIFIGDDILAMQMTRELEKEGIFATPVISPAVPPKEALIRTSYMASHKREELQFLLDTFEKIRNKFKLKPLQ